MLPRSLLILLAVASSCTADTIGLGEGLPSSEATRDAGPPPECAPFGRGVLDEAFSPPDLSFAFETELRRLVRWAPEGFLGSGQWREESGVIRWFTARLDERGEPDSSFGERGWRDGRPFPWTVWNGEPSALLFKRGTREGLEYELVRGNRSVPVFFPIRGCTRIPRFLFDEAWVEETGRLRVAGELECGETTELFVLGFAPQMFVDQPEAFTLARIAAPDGFPRIGVRRIDPVPQGGFVALLGLRDERGRGRNVLLRADTQGTPEPSFGDVGFVDLEPQGVRALALSGDGIYVLGLGGTLDERRSLLTRYTLAGALDRGFGRDGVFQDWPNDPGSPELWSLVSDGVGGTYGVGRMFNTTGSPRSAVYRFDRRGLDRSFGTEGWVDLGPLESRLDRGPTLGALDACRGLVVATILEQRPAGGRSTRLRRLLPLP